MNTNSRIMLSTLCTISFLIPLVTYAEPGNLTSNQLSQDQSGPFSETASVIVEFTEETIAQKKKQLNEQVVKKSISMNTYNSRLSVHHAKITSQHRQAEQDIRRVSPTAQIKRRFKNSVNGFSVTLPKADIEKIKNLLYVSTTVPL